MRGEFPETLCIEQGVVLSCRFAESKVRWSSCVLWMAVVSQSCVKSSRRNSASSGVGSEPVLTNHRRSPTTILANHGKEGRRGGEEKKEPAWISSDCNKMRNTKSKLSVQAALCGGSGNGESHSATISSRTAMPHVYS